MYDISGIPARRVAVLGQGYVGLPVAIRAVEVGFEVVGFDIDKTRIDCLRKAETYIDDITDSDLAIAMSTGRYLPSDDPSALAGFDVAVVCVPTPLRDGVPDLSYVEDAAAVIASRITPGCCIILESTSYPGTTEEIFIPILEAGSGLRSAGDSSRCQRVTVTPVSPTSAAPGGGEGICDGRAAGGNFAGNVAHSEVSGFRV